MKGLEQFAFCVTFLVAVSLFPSSSTAQSPFDGTWRIYLNQSKFSSKPIVAFLSEGWYHCTSCNPQLDVKADGAQQPVIGQPYDTISVREINSKSIQVTTQKAGVITMEQTRTVSNDGRTLTVNSIEHPANGGPVVTIDVTATRIGIASAAINGTSGSWRITKIQQSENGLLTTYKSNGDELTMTQPTGETYTARFDGKNYPVKGAYYYNAVSLKRIDKNTFEETDKRDGTIVEVAKITVSPDGKKMTIVDTNPLTDRTSTYIAAKQ